MTNNNCNNSNRIFISYAHRDNEGSNPDHRWLDRLMLHLSPLGLQDIADIWTDTQIEIGDHWDNEITVNLQNAVAAVLLVSPGFLASKYIRNNELPVLLKRADQEGTLILPIIVSECMYGETKFKYPDPGSGPEVLSLSIFQSANPPDRPLDSLEPYEQNKILVSVARRILKLVEDRKDEIRKGSPTDGVFNLPYRRNEFFTGREDILNHLRNALTEDHASAQTQAISGLGGIGKTQTAVEYAYRYRDQYHYAFWVSADTRLSVIAGFAEIAKALNLPESDTSDLDKITRTVVGWLEKNDDWLLIFDNADRPEILREFRPRDLKGHILITSRAQVFDKLGKIRPVIIKELPPSEAIDFLFDRTNRNRDDQAEIEAAGTLANELGYLPLALEQSAAFIATKQVLFQSYLTSYRNRGLALLSESKVVTGDHRDPVATTWSLNFSEIKEESRAASDLLRISAFLDPDRIPLELLTKGATKLGPSISEALVYADKDPVAVNNLLEPLMRYSVINYDRYDKSYSIHRLVQAVVRAEIKGKYRRLWFERGILALNIVFPRAEFDVWPLCERLIGQAKAVSDNFDALGIPSEEAGQLFDHAGYYFYGRAQYVEAQSFFLRSLKIWKALGPDHPGMANSLHALANLYRTQGKYAGAEPLYLRSLKMRENALGPDHPDVAESLNSLAVLYDLQDNYAKAERLYMRSLEIREKILGTDHLDVSESLCNLASLYHSQGKDTEAEEFFLRSLKICENVLGHENPNMAFILNNLASLYEDHGEYTKARPLYLRSLKISEKVLGTDHPDLSFSLNNLAGLYVKQGMHADAEPFYLRSNAILESAFGGIHPNLATGLRNYAHLLRETNREDEARKLEDRAKLVEANLEEMNRSRVDQETDGD